MDDEWTCGKGLAANAVLPATVERLMTATADLLDRHIRALDLSEAAGREERDAYAELVHKHRAIAGELAGLAERMSSFRDLPVARHDVAAFGEPEGQAEAFEAFVDVERELLALLTARMEEHERLLR